MARPAWPPPIITVSVYFMAGSSLDAPNIRCRRLSAVRRSGKCPSISGLSESELAGDPRATEFDEESGETMRLVREGD
jgi:hypothetical protein